MKQLLANAFTSLVTGIFFTAGLVACFFAFEHLSSDTTQPSDLEFTPHPLGLIISEHEKVEGVPDFTVRGIVENETSTTWTRMHVEVAILAGSAQVNTCERQVWGEFAPGDRRAFQVECFDVTGENLPDNVSYSVAVVSAGHER